ncbi:cation transporter [bacterium]|nr:cation transporter [bacterium]
MPDSQPLGSACRDGASLEHGHDQGHSHGHDHSHSHSHSHSHAKGHNHSHSHGHSHGHGHSHAPASFGRAFAIGISLNLAFVLVEAGFGFFTRSLTLLADAGHNLSDVLGLALAWTASVLSRRGPSTRYTYGLKGSSIIASLANAVLLLVAVGAIAWEALQRLWQPEPVASGLMMLVAGVGIVINTATALLFARGSQSDINIRGAYLHMAADAAVSAGVVIAGLLIMLTGQSWIDPLACLVVVAIIVYNTWGLLRESLDLSLSAVPAGLDPLAVRKALAALPGVQEVHDLHIWGMSTTESALTVHLVTAEPVQDNSLLVRAQTLLRQHFGIEHVTVQLEHCDGSHNCSQAPDDVI